MSQAPIISVVIPCFNYANFISATLDSVLLQSYTNWECLVVDDGSTDNSKDVVIRYAELDKRIRYIYQENKGLPAARNTGIRESQGEFLQFLDADDLIEKRKLELQLAFLAEHPEVDIVYGEARYFSTENPEQRRYSMAQSNTPWIPRISGKGDAVLDILGCMNIMPVSSPLVRRQIIDKCGLFDETLKTHEDWDFWLRLAFHGAHFSYYDEAETYTLIRGHARSMSRNLELMYQREMDILERLRTQVRAGQPRYNNRRRFARVGIQLAMANIHNGKYMLGLSRLIKFSFLKAWYMCARLFKANKF